MIQKFIDEVITWVGTPYRSRGCSKGKGTNCGLYILKSAEVTLPVGDVFKDAWTADHKLMLQRRMCLVGPILMKGCIEVPFEEIQPGDLALVEFCHVPIMPIVYVGNEEYVHCTRQLGVVKSVLPSSLRKKVVGVYRFKCTLKE